MSKAINYSKDFYNYKKEVRRETLAECQSNSCIREIIGCLMQDPQLLRKYPIGIEDFVNSHYKVMFSVIQNLAREGAKKIQPYEIEEFLVNRYETQYGIFKKYDCAKYLENALILSNVSNFERSYLELKKYSMLREYIQIGIDVSDVFNPAELDVEKHEKISKQFDSFDDLTSFGDYFKNKIVRINKDFNSRNNENSIKAGGDGALEQLQKWDEKQNYGISYASNLLNAASVGLRSGKFTLISAGTNTGKTRMTIANIAHSFAKKYYDPTTRSWENVPTYHKNIGCLYIGTEMNLREEIEPILEAYIACVPEEHILHPELYVGDERERVLEAVKILDESNIYLEHLPEYNCATLEQCISKYCSQSPDDCNPDLKVSYVFFDYIHITSALTAEFKIVNAQEGRDDQVLANLGNKLKVLASEYDISIDTWTQLNGDFGNDEVRDQRLIRGCKALADKADLCAIMSLPTERELAKINSLRTNEQIAGTLLCLSIYKNRNSRHKDIKIWISVDYSTMRVHDLFATTNNYTLYPLDKQILVIEDGDRKCYTKAEYREHIGKTNADLEKRYADKNNKFNNRFETNVFETVSQTDDDSSHSVPISSNDRAIQQNASNGPVKNESDSTKGNESESEKLTKHGPKPNKVLAINFQDNNKQTVFDSVSDAAHSLEIDESKIRYALSHPNRMIEGYKFCYYNKNN